VDVTARCVWLRANGRKMTLTTSGSAMVVRIDIGKTGAESWTVLADPEGNEFCVVRPKQTLTR